MSMWNWEEGRNWKSCKNFEESAAKSLKCLHHKDLKGGEENLTENWNLYYWL